MFSGNLIWMDIYFSFQGAHKGASHHNVPLFGGGVNIVHSLLHTAIFLFMNTLVCGCDVLFWNVSDVCGWCQFSGIFHFLHPRSLGLFYTFLLCSYIMQVPCSEHHFWPIEAHVRCVRVESCEMNLWMPDEEKAEKNCYTFGNWRKIQD